MGEVAEVLEKLTPAGRRVLDVAAELFYRQGIHAVGVEAITAGAGVTKKTLYACFGSKDQLVAAYLVERDLRWREWLADWVADLGGTARDELLGTFDALGAWMEHDVFRGCGFVNALAELPSPDHPAHAVVLAQKQWMRDHFAELTERAEVPDPEHLAGVAFLLYEGVAVAAATSTPEAVRRARKAMAALLAG